MTIRRGVLFVAIVALVLAAPAAGMRWLDDGPAITIELSPPSPVTTSDPNGADVTYSVKSHVDTLVMCTSPKLDGPAQQLTVTYRFSVGTTPIDCTDGINEAHASVTVALVEPPEDTTPPVVTVPANMTVPASSAAGAVVTFEVSATDETAPPEPVVTCTPPSGATFRVGETDVTCEATDAAGNKGTASFKVTVQAPPPPVDSAGPAFSNVPGAFTVEATSAVGSLVNYAAPSAADAVDGPSIVTCSPVSGSVFPLGTTTVRCSASDNHGNSNSVSFAVTVADTIAPTLIVPANASAYASTPTGLPANGYGLQQFLNGARATDLVDPNPRVRNDAAEFLGVGVHTVTFTAVDAAGNFSFKTSVFEVLPMPPAGTPPLPIPPPRTTPANVTNFRAVAGENRVQLSWRIPAGVDHVVLTRALTGGDPQQVYSGSGTSYVDREVANGLEYRYVIVSVDANGNESAGVVAVALPRRSLLRSPKDGAKLKAPPKLTWLKNTEATYYNVQLFRGQRKILSIWPIRPSLALKRTWKYAGKRYTLTRGAYTWYVWPGFGPRSAVDYGELLGSRSFQITR